MSTMSTEVIERIENEAASIREKLGPGNALHVSAACDVGEGPWQGDLGLKIIAELPKTGFKPAPAGSTRLVPEGGEGSRHMIADANTVELYYPEGWSNKYEGLVGPVFKCVKETTITHPTHGHVTFDAGVMVQCRYQREYDAELRRERRNAD